MRPIGKIAIAGTKTFRKAKGIFEIPIEQSFHLQVEDSDAPTAPNFLMQFQPDDLTELTMNSNDGVTDRTLEKLGHLHKLKYLAIPYTDITDTSLGYIDQLPELDALFIGQNPITEEGLLNLKRLTRLSSLGLNRMSSIHKILDRLKTSKNIEVLAVDGCSIDADDLEKIGAMKNIIELSIENNGKIKDDDIRLLSPLKRLVRFDISRTAITPKILPILREFPKLKTLQMSVGMWSDKDLATATRMYPDIHFFVYEKTTERIRANAKEFTPP